MAELIESFLGINKKLHESSPQQPGATAVLEGFYQDQLLPVFSGSFSSFLYDLSDYIGAIRNVETRGQILGTLEGLISLIIRTQIRVKTDKSTETHIEVFSTSNLISLIDVVLNGMSDFPNAKHYLSILDTILSENSFFQTSLSTLHSASELRNSRRDGFCKISKPYAQVLSTSLFSNYNVQSLARPSRTSLLNSLKSLFSCDSASIIAIGKPFLLSFVIAFDGEKDPRNLLIVFTLAASILSSFPVKTIFPFVPEFFELANCYFPIAFTSSAAVSVTGRDLKLALANLFASTPLLAPYVIPFLVSTAEGEADPSTRRDVLMTLSTCFEQYGAAAIVAIQKDKPLDTILKSYYGMDHPTADMMFKIDKHQQNSSLMGKKTSHVKAYSDDESEDDMEHSDDGTFDDSDNSESLDPSPLRPDELWHLLKKESVLASEPELNTAAMLALRSLIQTVCPDVVDGVFSLSHHTRHGAQILLTPMLVDCLSELRVPDAKLSRAHARLIASTFFNATKNAIEFALPVFWNAFLERFSSPYAKLPQWQALLDFAARILRSVTRVYENDAQDQKADGKADGMSDTDDIVKSIDEPVELITFIQKFHRLCLYKLSEILDVNNVASRASCLVSDLSDTSSTASVAKEYISAGSPTGEKLVDSMISCMQSLSGLLHVNSILDTGFNITCLNADIVQDTYFQTLSCILNVTPVIKSESGTVVKASLENWAMLANGTNTYTLRSNGVAPPSTVVQAGLVVLALASPAHAGLTLGCVLSTLEASTSASGETLQDDVSAYHLMDQSLVIIDAVIQPNPGLLSIAVKVIQPILIKSLPTALCVAETMKGENVEVDAGPKDHSSGAAVITFSATYLSRTLTPYRLVCRFITMLVDLSEHYKRQFRQTPQHSFFVSSAVEATEHVDSVIQKECSTLLLTLGLEMFSIISSSSTSSQRFNETIVDCVARLLHNLVTMSSSAEQVTFLETILPSFVNSNNKMTEDPNTNTVLDVSGPIIDAFEISDVTDSVNDLGMKDIHLLVSTSKNAVVPQLLSILSLAISGASPQALMNLSQLSSLLSKLLRFSLATSETVVDVTDSKTSSVSAVRYAISSILLLVDSTSTILQYIDKVTIPFLIQCFKTMVTSSEPAAKKQISQLIQLISVILYALTQRSPTFFSSRALTTMWLNALLESSPQCTDESQRENIRSSLIAVSLFGSTSLLAASTLDFSTRFVSLYPQAPSFLPTISSFHISPMTSQRFFESQYTFFSTLAEKDPEFKLLFINAMVHAPLDSLLSRLAQVCKFILQCLQIENKTTISSINACALLVLKRLLDIHQTIDDKLQSMSSSSPDETSLFEFPLIGKETISFQDTPLTLDTVIQFLTASRTEKSSPSGNVSLLAFEASALEEIEVMKRHLTSVLTVMKPSLGTFIESLCSILTTSTKISDKLSALTCLTGFGRGMPPMYLAQYSPQVLSILNVSQNDKKKAIRQAVVTCRAVWSVARE